MALTLPDLHALQRFVRGELVLAELSKDAMVELVREIHGRVGDTGKLGKPHYASVLTTEQPERVQAAALALWNGEGKHGSGHLVTGLVKPVTPTPAAPVATDAAARLAAALQELIPAAPQAPLDETAVRALIRDETETSSALVSSSIKDLADRMAVVEARKPEQVTRTETIVVTPQATTKLEEHTHPAFKECIDALGAGLHVLLVGPAGCGKSHLAEQVSRALAKKRYGVIHGSEGASESMLLGYLLPTGESGRFEYSPSEHVRCYAGPDSLFLYDELDAFSPNMLICVNGALANGHLHIPQRIGPGLEPVVAKGENVHLMATANTYGTGADMIYAGRNQLDATTLDRFYAIPMDYDSEWEKTLAPDYVVEWVHGVRRAIVASRMRRVMTTRAILKARALLAAGRQWDEIKERLLAGWTKDERAKLGMGGAL